MAGKELKVLQSWELICHKKVWELFSYFRTSTSSRESSSCRNVASLHPS